MTRLETPAQVRSEHRLPLRAPAVIRLAHERIKAIKQLDGWASHISLDVDWYRDELLISGNAILIDPIHNISISYEMGPIVDD